jgi:hypothetical protein
MRHHGIPANELSDDDLINQLQQLHRTRDDALRHGPEHALATHSSRVAELEAEYLQRWPAREVDPARQGNGGGERIAH